MYLLQDIFSIIDEVPEKGDTAIQVQILSSKQARDAYYQQDNQRLIQLLTPQSPGADAKKKSPPQQLPGDQKND